MHTESPLGSVAIQTPSEKSLAQHLLTAERVLMGVVLIACGLSGFVKLLVQGTGADSVLQASSSLLKAGFLYPLLKGAETLLQLWVSKAHA
ncbi:MAG TPA: hypothetical protein VFK05_13045 [Polyangiaceae bacterium]|nr:hypothetical protein [Polyangiaceae bacterium]